MNLKKINQVKISLKTKLIKKFVMTDPIIHDTKPQWFSFLNVHIKYIFINNENSEPYECATPIVFRAFSKSISSALWKYYKLKSCITNLKYHQWNVFKVLDLCQKH